MPNADSQTTAPRRYEWLAMAALLGGKTERGIHERQTNYSARAFNRQRRAFEPRLFWPLADQLAMRRRECRKS